MTTTKKCVPAHELTPHEIKLIVDMYCGLPKIGEADDPADDLRRLASVAAGIPGVAALEGELSAIPVQPGQEAGLDRLLDCGAGLLHAINPGICLDSWRELFSAIVTARYGGSYVRIRKRPMLGKMSDARHMTPKELMEKYGISRGHAYRLRKNALTKK